MSSIYEQLNEACRQFGKNVGEAIKEINYLIATSDRRERGTMAKVPYSEIMTRMHGDINYIAEEAYRDGYDHCEKEMKKKVDEAYKRGINDGSLDVKQRAEGAYQRGLDDAWEVARKIVLSVNEGGLSVQNLSKLFGTYASRYALKKYSASEAIEKLKAYEEKQKADDEIKVGDEVNWDGDNYIVTYINIDIDTSEVKDYDLMMWDGSVVDHVKKCSFVKTDRHFDIDKILEAMKE